MRLFMQFAFVIDPVHLLKAYKDTSVAMMRALQARGQAIFVIDQSEIYWSRRQVLARARAITVADDHHHWYTVAEPVVRALSSFAAVVMRKDPPFDMEYVYTTYLLELAEREGARVINRPRAIRDHNEKWPSPLFRNLPFRRWSHAPPICSMPSSTSTATSSSSRSTAWAERRFFACVRTIRIAMSSSRP